MGKYKILSGSALKTIALIAMIIDHTASIVLSNMAFATDPIITISSHKITLYLILRLIGRIAFPIYCFLITEGYAHTHDRKKYGINLLLFALISEIPWNLAHSGELLYPGQNVFFTLWIGYMTICIYEQYKEDYKKLTVIFIIIFISTILLRADYSIRGVGLILLLHLLRNSHLLRAFLGSAILNNPLAVSIAFIPIEMYNGKRGYIRNKVLKYAFYAIYPLHLLVLFWVKKHFIG